jgi:hypothetical protein
VKTFNLYCDESCYTSNPEHPYLLLGYIGVSYNQIDRHKREIKELRVKHKFFSEIKWSRVSHRNHAFYQELIEYFFASDLFFRAIIVNKDQINNTSLQQDNHTFYYKMYYQLIHHKIDMTANYNVYFDVKDALSKIKIRTLKEILNVQYGVFRNIQSIPSKESVFIQLADLFLGAISYKLRKLSNLKTKLDIIKKIEKESEHPLDKMTPKKEPKLNLFFIELKSCQ